MAPLRGRNEVDRRRQRLNSTFDQLGGSNYSPELVSHYARYLAVLISGYAEQSVKELVREYARNCSDPRIQRYVGKQIDRVRNIDAERLRQLIETLDPGWWVGIESSCPDELEAFRSIAAVRNAVSHGVDQGITIVAAREYFNGIDVVVKKISDLLDPAT